MNPPVKTNQAKRFKGFIDARVPPKSQIRAQNRCFNKNKVEVGILATSRRSKINKFYLKEFSPNYFDHDFPHVDAKLVPGGYQILKHRPRRSRSLSPVKKVYINRKRSNSLDSLSINRLFLILSTL